MRGQFYLLSGLQGQKSLLWLLTPGHKVCACRGSAVRRGTLAI